MPAKRYWMTLDDQKRPASIYTEAFAESGTIITVKNSEGAQLPIRPNTIPTDAVEVTYEQTDDIQQHPGRLRWDNGRFVGYRGGDDVQLYKEAIGDFLQTYARVESTAFELLQHYAGVSNQVARALFSGTRMKGALEYVKRIAEFTGKSGEIQEELRVISQQIGEITKARDLLVHYGTGFTSSGQGIISNMRVAGERTLQERPMSREILYDMKRDLEKLILHMAVLIAPHPPEHIAPNTPFGSVLHAPWRYKFVQPAGSNQTPPDRSPKQPRPPKPSRASRRRAAMDRKK